MQFDCHSEVILQCHNGQLVANHKERNQPMKNVKTTKGEEPFLKRTYNVEASKEICLQHTYKKTKFLHTLENSVTFLLVSFDHNVTVSVWPSQERIFTLHFSSKFIKIITFCRVFYRIYIL